MWKFGCANNATHLFLSVWVWACACVYGCVIVRIEWIQSSRKVLSFEISCPIRVSSSCNTFIRFDLVKGEWAGDISLLSCLSAAGAFMRNLRPVDSLPKGSLQLTWNPFKTSWRSLSIVGSSPFNAPPATILRVLTFAFIGSTRYYHSSYTFSTTIFERGFVCEAKAIKTTKMKVLPGFYYIIFSGKLHFSHTMT